MKGTRPTRSDRDAGLVPVEQALRIVLAEIPEPRAEETALAKARGRILAEPVDAPEDMPPFDRSMMDGYALRSADLAVLPTELRVVGFLPAGASAGAISVGQGEAVRIMTGAPIPAGADAVQMIERTEDLDSGRRVRVLRAVAAGEHIAKRGEDRRRGDRVLDPRIWLRAAEVGVLAAVGRSTVRVYRRPNVSLLSTGDEIVDPSETPLPHQIRNSNGPAILAAIEELGLAPASLGNARDDERELDAKIERGLGGDLLLLIGGVSVGDRDLAAERLMARGVRRIFHRVAMKPGKPLYFGRRHETLVFGLPGNPLSALTCFFLFVMPAIRAMMGLRGGGLPELAATLTSPLEQKPGRTWFRLARIELRGGDVFASPVRSTGSGDLASAARANGFIVMRAEVAKLEAGARVLVRPWAGFELLP